MITTISSSQDPRLDPLRLNERQLTTIAERRSTLAAGRFIAEGDLVVARALDSGYKPEVVLCDAEQATRFCDSIARGLGWDGLICDSTSADPLSRRALRVSMGSAFNLPFARTSDILQTLEMLRAQNFATYALTPSTSSLDLTQVKLEPTQKRALIFGSERAGLSETVLAKADTCIKIEMNPDVDSLNVAAAAAIACYSLR
ncbi:MAG: TrmH family RNA methyltransferase [Actinobacteria bacterium]|nr:TrmH family RNA methyltransferase [Actinomycetota bacterium]